MTKNTARALMIVAGLLILVVILGAGAGIWFFTTAINVGEADEASAAREFDHVRERFAGVKPVIEIQDEEPVVVRRPSEEAPMVRLSSFRIIAWDPDDGRVARIEIPFWLLRLKSGPIEIATDGGPFGGESLGITVEELERLGPTLVLDFTDVNGDRVIAWTE
jgi:hypothetical protein